MRKSYGGKEGVWLKKKRKHQDTSIAVHNSSQSKPKSGKTDCDYGHQAQSISQDFSVLFSSQRGTDLCHQPSKVRLVGWDEVLCRPIYQIASVNINSVSEDSKDEVDTELHSPIGMKETEGDDIDWLKTTKKSKMHRPYGYKTKGRQGLSAAASVLLEECCSPPSKNQTNICQPPRKLLKGKVDRLSSLSTEMQGVSFNTSASKNENSVTESSCETAEEVLLNSTPKPSLISICSALNSDLEKSSQQKGSTTLSVSQNSNVLLPDDFEDPKVNLFTNNKVELKPRITARRTYGKNCYNPQQKNNEKGGSAKIERPSSHTVLSVAKEYFSNLDVTQQLNLDFAEERGPQAPSSKCIRTRRKLNLTDPTLLKEYKLYHKVTSESGVTPLELNKYARCRSQYFSRDGLCDGLFEED